MVSRVLGGGGLGGTGIPLGTPWLNRNPARMHMHPGVFDNITNNQIFKLFVEKNPRIRDFVGSFIKTFHLFFFQSFFPFFVHFFTDILT